MVELAAENRCHVDLECGRTGQSGTAQHIAGGIAIKTAHLAARIDKTSRNTADQAGSTALLLRLWGQNREINGHHLAKAVGFQVNHIAFIGRDHRHHVQVHRSGHHNTVIMIRMVTANLGAAGR